MSRRAPSGGARAAWARAVGARSHRRPFHATGCALRGANTRRRAQPRASRAVLSGTMKIVIPGGTGQVGGLLARAFRADGHDVIILTRAGGAPRPRRVAWDGRTLGPWADEIDGADVVINLAGRSVNCRYTAGQHGGDDELARRLDARRGRWRSRAPPRPPRVWLQMSTATIYAHRFDAAERRGDRAHRRRRARRARLLAVQHRHREGVGAGAGRGARRRRPARSRCARRW